MKIGDIVIIKGEEKNWGRWKLAVVTAIILGRDGVIRVAKLRTGKGELERPIQFLYPLELNIRRRTANNSVLNAEAQEY